LIIARRIIASINGNPEFDAAKVSTAMFSIHCRVPETDWQMLRPYTYAYVRLRLQRSTRDQLTA
jgi:hypothetical protein